MFLYLAAHYFVNCAVSRVGFNITISIFGFKVTFQLVVITCNIAIIIGHTYCFLLQRQFYPA